MENKYMSNEARELLSEMLNSGQSEMAGVADIISTIGSEANVEGNGEPDIASDFYLVAYAEEIISSAEYFIKQLMGT